MKETDPDGSSKDFTFSGALNGTIRDGGRLEGEVPPFGSYPVTEAVPRGWEATAIRCTTPPSSGVVPSATATFRVGAGETVTCTFFDHDFPDADLRIIKSDTPDPVVVGQPLVYHLAVDNLGENTRRV